MSFLFEHLPAVGTVEQVVPLPPGNLEATMHEQEQDRRLTHRARCIVIKWTSMDEEYADAIGHTRDVCLLYGMSVVQLVVMARESRCHI